MKKTILAVSIFATLVMSGCRPETRNQMLGIPDDAILLSTEQFSGNGTKTSVSGTSVQWVSGDKVAIYVGTGNKQSKTVAISGDMAYLSSSLTSGTGPIRGYYPDGLIKSSGTTDSPNIAFPTEYECSVSDGRQVIALPMVARANDETATSLQFKHLTAAVNVMLNNSIGSTLYVDSVIVVSDSYRLSSGGNMGISLTQENFGYTPATTNTANMKKVKVYFTSSFEVSAGSSDKSIQVPIMPIGADNLTINVYCRSTDTRYVYSHKAATNALARNEMLTARVNLQTGEGYHMTSTNLVNVAALKNDITAMNGDIFTGAATKAVTISIPSGSTVTLQGVSNTSSYYTKFHAQGNANIKISGANTLYGSYGNSPVWVKSGSTLTIEEQGSGTLTCNGGSNAAGIGAGAGSGACGNILIKSGTINATGSANSAGIGCGASAVGSGSGSTCGTIEIQGGTVTATGGTGAAGIGTGNHSTCKCGTITITSGVTSVTATKGSDATHSIGKGNSSSTCGTVTIGGNTGYIEDSPYTYTPSSSK